MLHNCKIFINIFITVFMQKKKKEADEVIYIHIMNSVLCYIIHYTEQKSISTS